MACHVLLEVTIKEACHDKLKAKFIELLPDTRSFDGCFNIYITQDQDKPDKLVIVEIWESRSHYEKYLAWRTERGDMDVLGEMMENPTWHFLDSWGV